MSITRKTDGNFGNVSAGVLFSKVRCQQKTVVIAQVCIVKQNQNLFSYINSYDLPPFSLIRDFGKKTPAETFSKFTYRIEIHQSNAR